MEIENLYIIYRSFQLQPDAVQAADVAEIGGKVRSLEVLWWNGS